MTNIDEIIDRLRPCLLTIRQYDDEGLYIKYVPTLNIRKVHDVITEFKQAVIAECGKDTERLDWLQKNGPWEQWIRPGEDNMVLRDNVRDAIDGWINTPNSQ